LCTRVVLSKASGNVLVDRIIHFAIKTP
jgi:hypothetical protein